MDPNELLRLDRLANKGFTYKFDEAGNDQWISYANEVLAGKAWRGDCDDLGSTVLDLLNRAGWRDHHLWRLEVSSDARDRVNHFVGMAKDINGTLWIVGDTFGLAHRLTMSRHKIIYQSRFDWGLEWRTWEQI